MAKWFFFSYARADWDEHLEKFFEDLAKEVRKKKPIEEAGFLDQSNIELGEKWNESLKEALRSTRVFVSMCSPTYITREYCGKEVQVCLSRIPAAGSATAFFPLLWESPSRSAHAVLSPYQNNHIDLPADYHQHGLRYLMRLSIHKDDYQKCLDLLANKIVEAGERSPLVEFPHLPAFENVPNAFAATPPAANQTQSKGGTPSGKDAAFVFVTPDGRYWKPFHPECDDPIALSAMQAASKYKLIYNDLPVDDQIVKRVKEAEERKQIVILVVDPVSVQVSSYEQYLRAYDDHNYLNSAVLVVWNPRAGAAGETLRKRMAQTFRYRAGIRKSVYYVDTITSQPTLQSALAKTIAKLRASLIEHSDLPPGQGIDAPELLLSARAQGIDPSRQPTVGSPSGGSPR